jgi:hypothetical protein
MADISKLVVLQHKRSIGKDIIFRRVPGKNGHFFDITNNQAINIFQIAGENYIAYRVADAHNITRHYRLDINHYNLLSSGDCIAGVHFIRNNLMVFIDDDALMSPGNIATACRVMLDNDILTLHGRILPNSIPPAVSSLPPVSFITTWRKAVNVRQSRSTGSCTRLSAVS